MKKIYFRPTSTLVQLEIMEGLCQGLAGFGSNGPDIAMPVARRINTLGSVGAIRSIGSVR